MKKLLLTTAALVALVAPGNAAAADTLPREMLGRWCPSTEGSFNVYNGIFKRGNCKDTDSSILVKQNLIEYWESGCMRWLRLSEQNFRVDKWSLCRVRPPRGKAAS